MLYNRQNLIGSLYAYKSELQKLQSVLTHLTSLRVKYSIKMVHNSKCQTGLLPLSIVNVNCALLVIVTPGNNVNYNVLV